MNAPGAALVDASRATQIQPNHEDANYLTALSAIYDGNDDLAIRSLQKCIANGANPTRYHYMLAAAYARQNMTSNSKMEYAKGLRLDPNYVWFTHVDDKTRLDDRTGFDAQILYITDRATLENSTIAKNVVRSLFIFNGPNFRPIDFAGREIAEAIDYGTSQSRSGNLGIEVYRLRSLVDANAISAGLQSKIPNGERLLADRLSVGPFTVHYFYDPKVRRENEMDVSVFDRDPEKRAIAIVRAKLGRRREDVGEAFTFIDERSLAIGELEELVSSLKRDSINDDSGVALFEIAKRAQRTHSGVYSIKPWHFYAPIVEVDHIPDSVVDEIPWPILRSREVIKSVIAAHGLSVDISDVPNGVRCKVGLFCHNNSDAERLAALFAPLKEQIIKWVSQQEVFRDGDRKIRVSDGFRKLAVQIVQQVQCHRDDAVVELSIVVSKDQILEVEELGRGKVEEVPQD